MISEKCIYYIVDHAHPLPADYIPNDLVIAPIPFVASCDDPRCLIRSVMFFPLKSLYFAARDCGLHLYGICAYRSFDQQKILYESNLKANGISYANRFIAPPGASEHQTGLAIDLSCPDNDFALNENFADTREGIWLAENAYRFGFVFPYGPNTYIKSGYPYEPWHLRYACKYGQFYGIINRTKTIKNEEY